MLKFEHEAPRWIKARRRLLVPRFLNFCRPRGRHGKISFAGVLRMRQALAQSGNAKTYKLFAVPARKSGVSCASPNVFGVPPVLIAMYCLPFTA